jgi:NAD(P)-dependent dehydrogenase (short-subunit alcohol dehydrogenase family)
MLPVSTTKDPSKSAFPPGDFDGQCVVVTGAGSGIGRATAMTFAKEGARLALLDVSRAGLDETLRLVGSEDHLALECDVSRPAAIASAFSQIDGVLGPVNVLVNNAGINPPVESSLDVDESYFDRVMSVNSKGIFFCAQAAMRSMVPWRSGVIVNLGSVSGMIGWGGSAVYSASKGAVLALTKALAMELAPYSIRVNAVAPGSVRTPMVQNNVDLGDDPDNAWERIAALHPLGRPGEPEDIANAIAYLASARSSFVTGSILTIDGGLTAQ